MVEKGGKNSKVLLIESDMYYRDLYRELLRPHFDLHIATHQQSRAFLVNNKGCIASIITDCYHRYRDSLRRDGLSLLRYSRAQGLLAPFILLAEFKDKYLDWESDQYGVFELLYKGAGDFHTRLLATLRVAVEFHEYQIQRQLQESDISDKLGTIPNITPIKWDYTDANLYDAFFEIDSNLNQFCYANSWAYICQAARKNGHKFFDGNSLITITGQRRGEDIKFEIIRPLGQYAAKKAYQLAQQLKKHSNCPIIFKRLEPTQFKSLVERGCRVLEQPQTKRLVDFFDDVHPQVVLDLNAFLGSLNLPQMAWFRKGLRQFANNNYTIKELKPHLFGDVRHVLSVWKKSFISRYEKRGEFSSVPEDDAYYFDPYLPFVEHFGRSTKREASIATIIYVDDIPAGFSFLSRISDSCLAMYANVADTKHNGISYFMLYQNFLRALWSGYTFINLGGTEASTLYDFFYRLTAGQLEGDFTGSSHILWKGLSLADLDKVMGDVRSNIRKKIGKDQTALRRQLSQLDAEYFFTKMSEDSEKIRVHKNLIPRNQVLERKCLVL